MEKKLTQIPIFDDNQFLYMREEEENHLTFTPRKHPEVQHLEMNALANYIRGLCDGSQTVEDIINKIADNYKSVKREVISNDVVGTLHNFWKMGLITWKDGIHPYVDLYQTTKNEYLYKMLSEDETIEALKKISIKDCKVNPYVPEELGYYELPVRQKVFGYRETFFVLSNGSEDLLMISLLVSMDMRKSLIVGLMHFNNLEIDPKVVKDFVQWSIERYSKFVSWVKGFTRVDLYLKEDVVQPEFKAFLENVDFNYNQTLKKELGWDSPDIQVFSYDVSRH